MAETGLSLVVTKEMLEKLQRADHLITNLATKSEQAEKRIIASFKRMGDDGVGAFIRRLNEVQNKLSSFGNVKIGSANFDTFNKSVTNAIDIVNKLASATTKIPKENIVHLQLDDKKGGVSFEETLNRYRQRIDQLKKEMDIFKSWESGNLLNTKDYAYIGKVADEVNRLIVAYDALYKAQQSLNKSNFNSYIQDLGGNSFDDKRSKEILAKMREYYLEEEKRIQANAKQQAKAESEKRKELERTAKEAERIAKQQAKAEELRIRNESRMRREDYNRYISTQDTYDHAMKVSGRATTINQSIRAIQALEQARKNLRRTDEDYIKKLNNLNAAISHHKKLIDNATKGVDNLRNKHRGLLNITEQLSRRIALVFSVSQITGYVQKLIQVRGEFELQQRSLQALLQNKDEANKLWQQTIDLAVRSPFRVKELVTYTKQLAAYRIESDKLYETNKMLADISAGLGVDMQRLILAYGQVKAANYLRGTELRQFSEAGVNILGELAKYFSELEGRAISVGDVFEMVSKRMVAFSDVEEVFKRLTSEGGTFYRMQEIQSDTLKGMVSNLKDSIDLMMNEIGSNNDGVIKSMVSTVKTLVENWREVALVLKEVIIAMTAWKGINHLVTLGMKEAKTIQIWYNKLVKEKIAVTLKDVQTMTLAEAKMMGLNRAQFTLAKGTMFLQGALLGVKAILKTLLPFLIIAGIIELTRRMTEASRAAKQLQKDLEDIYNEDTSNLDLQVKGYENLVARMKDVNRGSAEHKELIDAINSRYGEYIGYIVDEKTTYDQLKASIESVNLALTRKAKLSTFEKAIAKVYESTNKAIMDTEKSFINMANNILVKFIDGEALGLQINDDEIGKVFNVIDNKIKNLGRTLTRLEIKDAISEALGISVDYINTQYSYQGINELVDIIDKRSEAILTRKEKELEINKQINRIYKDNANSASEAQKAFEKLAKDEQDELKAASNKPRWEQEDIKRQFAEQRIDLQVKFEGLDASVAEARKKAIRELDATINDINRQIEHSTTKLGEKYANLIYITPDEAATGLSSIAESTAGSYKAQQEIIKQQNGLKEAGTKYDAQILENAEKTAAAYYYKLQIMGRLDLLQKETNKEESKELQTLNRQISALKEAKQTFDNLRKTFSDEEATTRTASAFEQLFKDVGIDDITIGMTFDESGIMKVLKDIPNKAGEAGKIAKEKFNAELSGALDIEGKEKLDKQLLNSIQDMFTGYEVSLELQKLNIPPDLAKSLFDVDTITLPELKTDILELKPQFKGQDMLKEWDRIIKQLDQLEAKQQEENAKRFVKFLNKTLDESKVILEQKGVDVAFAKKLFDEGKISAEQFGEVIKNIVQEANTEISKVNLDNFKKSALYLKSMGNLSSYSTRELKKMHKELSEILAQNSKNMDVQELKEYHEVLKKINQQIKEQKPFLSNNNIANMTELIRLQKELYKEKEKEKNLESEKGELEKKRTSLLKLIEEAQSKANSGQVVSTQNLKNQLVATEEQISQIDSLLNNAGINISSITDSISGITGGGAGGAASAMAMIDMIVQGVNNTCNAAKKTFEDIVSLAESFGTDTSKGSWREASLFFEGMSNFNAEVTQGWENFKSGNFIGAVANTIGSIVGFIRDVNKWKDSNAEEGIQEQIESIEKLEKAYRDLEKAVDEAYSVSSFEKANDAAMQNLNERIDAIENMIQLEEDKKDTDQERIDEWNEDLKQMRESLQELEDERVESLGGFGNKEAYKSAAEEFVSAWLDAYKEAGDGLSGLNEQFNTFFENMLTKQLMMRGVDKFLQPFYDQFDAMFDKGSASGGLATKEELDAIKDMWSSVSPQLNDFLNGLMGSLGVAQDLASGELSGLQRGIQGITETQADVIASYLNSIRFFVADNSTKLSTFIDSFTSSETPNPILSELRSQSDILRTIRDMFSSVIGSGNSATHSGSYIKVVM